MEMQAALGVTILVSRAQLDLEDLNLVRDATELPKNNRSE
jgi:hypothetical protein